MYVREITKEVYHRPNKELKAFRKVFVRAHEKATVVVELDESAFAYYSVAKDRWTVKPGLFEIIIAANVQEEKLLAKIVL